MGRFASILGQAVLIAVLSAPAAAAPAPEVSGRSAICTMEYRPVCARTRFGRLLTFPNACVARRERARVLHRGVCGRRR